MKTVLLFKELYLEAFRDFGNFVVRNYLKAFTWFSFALFFIVLYAFVFRLFTGFVWD
ncbi:DUF6747 family protein [Robiginitalea sp. IMCC43444]|uniref:DUF6747 family protein n=1 Tax=Robiginitalea sp. IMCC43444 TaxID=3459121 RepID=UPI00404333BE